MKRKLVFALVAALLLFPWTVAYAYDEAAAFTGPIVISTAEESSLPQFNAFGNATGGVTRGDIFTIDSTASDSDTSFTLSLTNTDDLIHNFRYITLNVSIYIRTSDGAWEKTLAVDNSGDIYLTMQNGNVSFSLAGGARYKITIEKGCFYCYGAGAARTVALPDFYLTSGS